MLIRLSQVFWGLRIFNKSLLKVHRDKNAGVKGKEAFVIDPGESEPVERFIKSTIKFVRKYFSQIGKDCKNRIITLKNGFHGRSMAGVSACGSNFAKKGFAPLLQGFDNILINFCISSSILLLFMINRIILESE